MAFEEADRTEKPFDINKASKKEVGEKCGGRVRSSRESSRKTDVVVRERKRLREKARGWKVWST